MDEWNLKMESGTSRGSIRNVDVFVAVNILLFLWMCFEAYYDRFVHYRGSEYIWEFFVYAVAIVFVMLLAWRVIRDFTVPTWLLVMTQIGIAMHFSGGLAMFHESRLYDKIILGIRYDKYVHMVNAMVVGCYVHRVPWIRTLRRAWLCDLLVVVLVLGLGAVVEIVEYLVTLTVTVNGVGDYDNNMQDLIFNLTGVTFYVTARRVFHRAFRKKAAGPVSPGSECR